MGELTIDFRGIAYHHWFGKVVSIIQCVKHSRIWFQWPFRGAIADTYVSKQLAKIQTPEFALLYARTTIADHEKPMASLLQFMQ